VANSIRSYHPGPTIGFEKRLGKNRLGGDSVDSGKKLLLEGNRRERITPFIEFLFERPQKTGRKDKDDNQYLHHCRSSQTGGNGGGHQSYTLSLSRRKKKKKKKEEKKKKKKKKKKKIKKKKKKKKEKKKEKKKREKKEKEKKKRKKKKKKKTKKRKKKKKKEKKKRKRRKRQKGKKRKEKRKKKKKKKKKSGEWERPPFRAEELQKVVGREGPHKEEPLKAIGENQEIKQGQSRKKNLQGKRRGKGA